MSVCTLPVGSSRPNRVRACAVLLGNIASLLALEAAADERTAERLLLARTNYGVNATPADVTCTAKIDLEIGRPGLDRLRISAPAEWQIVDIASDRLESWRAAPMRGRQPAQELELVFREPIQGRHCIAVTAVRASELDQPWSIPALAVEGADAHEGRVTVECPDGFYLGLENSQAARPIARDCCGLTFDVRGTAFQLEFTTRAKQERVHSDLTTTLVPAADAVCLIAVAELRPQNGSLFELQASLPAEWRMCELQLDGQSVEWYALPDQAGVHRIRVPLYAPVSHPKAAQLLLKAERALAWPQAEGEPVEIALPEVRLPQVTRCSGRYVIEAAGEYTATAIDPVGLRPSAQAHSGNGLIYECDGSPIGGGLRIQKAAPPEPADSTETEPSQTSPDRSFPPANPSAIAARKARATSVLDPAGHAQHRVEYTLDAPDVAAFVVALPRSARLHRALIDRAPCEVLQTGQAFRIICNPQQGERTLALEYATEESPIGRSGTLRQSLATLRGCDSAGHEMPVQPLEQRWSVAVPAGIVPTENLGAFQPDVPLRSAGWLAAVVRRLATSGGAVWPLATMASLILLVWSAPSRRSLRAVAGILLALGAAGLLTAANDPARSSAAANESGGRALQASTFHFHYSGGAQFEDGEPLAFRYTSGSTAAGARLAAATCAAFLLWPLRRRGRRVRLVLGTAGAALPIALVSLVASEWQPWLDGVLLGTLAGAPLWLLSRRAPQILTSPSVLRAAAGVLIAAAVQSPACAGDPSALIRVESATAVRIGDAGIRLAADYRVGSLTGTFQELTFAIPEGLKIRAVDGPQVASWRVQQASGVRQLLVHFEQAVDTTSLSVHLFQATAFDEGTTAYQVPSFGPAEVDRESGTISVFAPEHLDIHIVAAEGLHRIDPVPPDPARSEMDLPELSWIRTGKEPKLTLAVLRAGGHTSVAAFHAATIERERLRMSSTFRIEGPGDPLLRFSAFVPEGYRVADLRGPHLANWTMEEGLLTAWFDRPQQVPCEVELDLEATRDPESDRAEIAVPLPLDMEGLVGVLAISVDASLQSAISGEDFFGWKSVSDEQFSAARERLKDGVPLVVLWNDSQEPLPVGVGLAAREPADRREPAAAPENSPDDESTTTKPHFEDVTPGAVVQRAGQSVILERDGTWRMDVAYSVRNRTRSHLRVVLPNGSRLLSTTVNGEPVRARSASEQAADLLVPVPAENQAASVVDVKLVLTGGPGARGSIEGGLIELAAPVIPSVESDPVFGMPVIDTTWRVTLPRSHRAEVVDADSWLSQRGALLEPLRDARRELHVSRSGHSPRLVLAVSQGSPIGVVSIMAALTLVACVIGVARRQRVPRPAIEPERSAVSAAAPPELDEPERRPASRISALPHESGIFLPAVRRPAEHG